MKKTFVLDANVLLHDPVSPFRFADNDVVIPLTVVEELDHFKREMTERGRNAREVSRRLDALGHKGRLTDGLPTDGGGTLRIHLGVRVPDDWPFLDGGTTADMRILAVAWALEHESPPVTLVTKDTNLRIKAEAVGLKAEDYVERGAQLDASRMTYRELDVERAAIDALFRDGSLPVDELGHEDPGPNACLLLRDRGDAQHTAPVRRKPNEAAVAPLDLPRAVSGITPRNLEQRFALDLLLDPALPLVTLAGKAGTGKTLLALAAGLAMTLDRKHYRRLLVARPIFPMGRDLGYLPGEIEEKLRPWMQPVFDNLELLLGDGGDGRGNRPEGAHPVDILVEQGLLEIEPLTYIRGRSLPRQYMIVDEAQNLTPLEVKTVVTRAGEDTKVVLTGDPEQIDNPYVDASSNGLSYASQQLLGQPLAGSVMLTRGERSPLAELAADRL